MAPSAIPQPASTVVLVRPDATDSFEIFMNRRPDKMDVYAGIYVFPGGRVEESDRSPQMLKLTRGLTAADAQQQLGGELNADHCLGHWVAAVRELFEEAGIYLFVSQSSAMNGSASRELSQRLAEKRAALQDRTVEFSSLLTAENLCCDLGQLVYFFHRITPEHYPVRFDTRFYLAALPPQQTPLDSSEEVSESLWISAATALERFESGIFPMMPPTVTVLRTLAGHGSWNALTQAFRL